MMAGLLNFTVETLLNQQIELIGPAAVSLDSLWRAAGSPTQHSPRNWVELAAPLLAGFSRYLGESPPETHRHGQGTAASLGLGG